MLAIIERTIKPIMKGGIEKTFLSPCWFDFLLKTSDKHISIGPRARILTIFMKVANYVLDTAN